MATTELLSEPLDLNMPDQGDGLRLVPQSVDPHFDEGFSYLQGDYDAQQEALASLTLPEAEVVRRTPRGDPERFRKSTIFHESVRFRDGAVRLATHVVPDNPVTDVLTVSADPWVTGDKGFNEHEIHQMAAMNFPLLWIHHQGRHRIFPPNKERLQSLLNLATPKSVAIASAQELAVVEDIAETTPANTRELMRRGYSRSGMSGNAFIVLAKEKGIDVVLSHFEGECFPHALGMSALVKTFLDQVPDEGATISGVVAELTKKATKHPDIHASGLRDYAKTLDLHPLNLINEALWIPAFKTGEAGTFASAVPLDAQGIRIHYEGDRWSHIAKWLDINAPRPGITTLEMPGAHTAGASWKMQLMKGSTFRNIARYAREHDGSLDGITADAVIAKKYRKYIVSA